MNQIINVTENTVGAETIQTVNARELHDYLGVGKQFSHWIQDRIEMYDFKEDLDYVTTEAKVGYRQNVIQKNYFVSLDMAKELSMVDRGEKGKAARKYFIDCEKKLKENIIALPDFTNPAEAAIAWANEYKAKEALQIEMTAAKPKIAFHDSVTESDNVQTIEEVAKALDIGRNSLFKLLRSKGILCNNNLPVQYYLDRKWFEVVSYNYKRENGEVHTNAKTTVTGKGFTEIHKLIKGN
jgi:anti-repressor protein